MPTASGPMMQETYDIYLESFRDPEEFMARLKALPGGPRLIVLMVGYPMDYQIVKQVEIWNLARHVHVVVIASNPEGFMRRGLLSVNSRDRDQIENILNAILQRKS